MSTIKYKVVNATSLSYRKSPTLKGDPVGYLKENQEILVVSGWSLAFMDGQK